MRPVATGGRSVAHAVSRPSGDAKSGVPCEGMGLCSEKNLGPRAQWDSTPTTSVAILGMISWLAMDLKELTPKKY